MKLLVGFLVILIKLYCGFKISQWIYFQFTDKLNHPISEIEPLLVFLILDIWLMTSVNHIQDRIDDITV